MGVFNGISFGAAFKAMAARRVDIGTSDEKVSDSGSDRDPLLDLEVASMMTSVHANALEEVPKMPKASGSSSACSFWYYECESSPSCVEGGEQFGAPLKALLEPQVTLSPQVRKASGIGDPHI